MDAQTFLDLLTRIHPKCDAWLEGRDDHVTIKTPKSLTASLRVAVDRIGTPAIRAELQRRRAELQRTLDLDQPVREPVR